MTLMKGDHKFKANQFAKYLQLATEKVSVVRAFKVALIVGVILNLINNPQIFYEPRHEHVHLIRILLTFLVPFLVSLYSSVLANSEK